MGHTDDYVISLHVLVYMEVLATNLFQGCTLTHTSELSQVTHLPPVWDILLLLT